MKFNLDVTKDTKVVHIMLCIKSLVETFKDTDLFSLHQK